MAPETGDTGAVATAVVQIGNSDNKLTQGEWSGFIEDLYTAAVEMGQIHFFGFSDPTAPWQNCCVVVEIPVPLEIRLRATLSRMARDYRQDSIALTVGTTHFVPAKSSARLPMAG